MLVSRNFALRHVGAGLAVLVAAAGAPSLAAAPQEDPLQQHAYLKVSNGGAFDNLGAAVAISGQYLMLGAPGEASAASASGSDNSAFFAGAVYPFVRTGVGYAQLGYLKAANAEAGDGFGSAIALSGDTLVVGAERERSAAQTVNGNASDNSAPNAGAVYVFVRNGLGWTQQAYLKASNAAAEDRFGGAVAIAGDTIVVGARGEDSGAVGVNGNSLDESASASGAVYVFVRSGTEWTQQAYLKPSNTSLGDAFGAAVAIHGNTIVVGAPDEDGSATTVNGAFDDATSAAGAAYVFVRNGTTWTAQAYLKPSNPGMNDRFGTSVACAGNSVLVGAPFEDGSATGVNGPSDDSAPNSGAAYVFARSGTTWSQQAYLKATNTGNNDAFGGAVALAGDRAVIGAAFESSGSSGVDADGGNDTAPASGAAYVFTRTAGVWGDARYLKASNTGGGDQFGSAVAISGTTIVIGAALEDSNATTVNGNGADDNGNAAGAGYLFDAPFTLAVTCSKVTLNDKKKPQKDSLSFQGNFVFGAPSPDFVLAPLTEGATIHCGSGTGFLRLELPAGPGWKATSTGFKFKSAVGAKPAIDFTLDLAKSTFKLKASSCDFPVPLANPAGITLTLGNDGGTWFGAFQDTKQHTKFDFP